MTATTTPFWTHYQDTHITSPLTPTRCHPTAHSHRLGLGETPLTHHAFRELQPWRGR
ncbi:hypothetical protein ABZ016_39980 [Streptomyces sp. NPDC006372]|uniref:hypothetical protein n=1 Tax=Streptomyces sp. NPDC006372 TaxID=3155599 RepID=UPI0033A90D22